MTTSSTSSSTSASSSTGFSNLDTTWQAVITKQITAEKQVRLNNLTKQSSDLDLRKAIFTDLSNQISSLKSTLGKLWSSDVNYVGNSAKSASISNSSLSGGTILTATADSTASLGTYTVSEIKLATQQRVSSDAQTSSSTALGSGFTGSFSIQVKGGTAVNISIDGSSDTLYSIMSKINDAKYDTGKGVSASIVDNKLVLQSNSTGSDYTMSLTETNGTPLQALGIKIGDEISGYTFKNSLQSAVDATFKMNGSLVTRSSNTGLTDVVQGVTLNLAADAAGNSATLTVQSDVSALKSSLQSFITQYNALQTYLANKTGTTKVSDTQYTPGALANEFSVRSLKSDLTDHVSFSTGSAAVKYFSDMGITLANGQLSISDSSKLNNAITNNASDVKSFMDSKMSSMNTLLGSYVGSDTSFVTYSLQSMTDRKTLMTKQITDENTRLNSRQQALITYYQGVQAQITAMSNTQSALSSYIYSSIYGTSKTG